jgi:hypothetical protein
MFVKSGTGKQVQSVISSIFDDNLCPWPLMECSDKSSPFLVEYFEQHSIPNSIGIYYRLQGSFLLTELKVQIKK